VHSAIYSIVLGVLSSGGIDKSILSFSSFSELLFSLEGFKSGMVRSFLGVFAARSYPNLPLGVIVKQREKGKNR